MKIKDYQPLKGFYDLRAFKIPTKDFRKLWGIQKFLFNREQERLKGKIHPQIDEIRNFSAQYQQTLFSYPIIKPELL